MPRIEIFHNVSRDGSFGLNTVFRTSETEPAWARATKMPSGQWGWKDFAAEELTGTDADERHPLTLVHQYDTDWQDSNASTAPILRDAWERFNNGSGKEDPAYFGRHLRSLMVGDVIRINGDAHAVEHVGFEPCHRDDLRIVTGAEAERLIRDRYQLREREELVCTVPLDPEPVAAKEITVEDVKASGCEGHTLFGAGFGGQDLTGYCLDSCAEIEDEIEDFDSETEIGA